MSALTVTCYKPRVTKYDLFRRRIAPIAFGVAIVLLARESCRKQEAQQARATIVIDIGAADVRAIDAEVWEAGAEVAVFHRRALDGRAIGAIRFDAPVHDGEVRLDVTLASGVRHVVRPLHADDGAVVTVPLGEALR